MTEPNQHITMTEGEYKQIVISVFSDEDKTIPQDLTNYTGSWQAERVSGVAHTITKTTAISGGMSFGTEPTLGIITITLDHADTDGYDGSYNHECRIFDNTGLPETVCTGRLYVRDTMFETP